MTPPSFKRTEAAASALVPGYDLLCLAGEKAWYAFKPCLTSSCYGAQPNLYGKAGQRKRLKSAESNVPCDASDVKKSLTVLFNGPKICGNLHKHQN